MASPTQWTGVEQSPEDGAMQGSPACCRPWGHKESGATQGVNSGCRHPVVLVLSHRLLTVVQLPWGDRRRPVASGGGVIILPPPRTW